MKEEHLCKFILLNSKFVYEFCMGFGAVLADIIPIQILAHFCGVYIRWSHIQSNIIDKMYLQRCSNNKDVIQKGNLLCIRMTQ